MTVSADAPAEFQEKTIRDLNKKLGQAEAKIGPLERALAAR